ncbi:MAG TPA: hypothetical protein GX704_01120 [Clostridiales bacterium]|nr:hypothetical protein [Clostridiales bacterium]
MTINSRNNNSGVIILKPKVNLSKILLTSAGPLLCIIGAAAVMFGHFRGEAGVVLSKAIMVCMECIGIG